MKSKSARLVRRNHARYHQGRDDLNIVPMIDMMVILVFFLIFTAVFSKTSILQLNLPASSTEVPLDLPKTLNSVTGMKGEPWSAESFMFAEKVAFGNSRQENGGGSLRELSATGEHTNFHIRNCFRAKGRRLP